MSLRLSNDAKIKAGNFFNVMQDHVRQCEPCYEYLCHGDGDLCARGNEIVALELAYIDTAPVPS